MPSLHEGKSHLARILLSFPQATSRTRDMNDPTANRRYLAILAFLGVCWLLLFQPGRNWSGSLQISKVRIAFSLASDPVRFRTPLSGNGHTTLSLQFGSDRS
jgi:hypothetical protein